MSSIFINQSLNLHLLHQIALFLHKFLFVINLDATAFS